MNSAFNFVFQPMLLDLPGLDLLTGTAHQKQVLYIQSIYVIGRSVNATLGQILRGLAPELVTGFGMEAACPPPPPLQ